MPASHPLDDADARQAVIDAVESHGQLADAAQAAGVNIRRLSRYLKTHPGFADEVAAARHRSEVIAHHAPRMLPAPANPPMGDPGESTTTDHRYPAPGSPDGRAQLFKLLWDHAGNGESRACSKSCDILAQLAFAPELIAMQAKAKREAAQLEQAGEKGAPMRTQLVIVKQDEQRVVDAEVIERDPRNGS